MRISIRYLVYAIAEENGQMQGYDKGIFKNGTDTLVCDTAVFRQPFNCKVMKPLSTDISQ